MPSTKLKSFVAKHRQTRRSFKAYPEHAKPVSFPITYIEPIASNRAALGLDMAHEANRFTAAKKAQHTGQAQITGPITLVQDKEKTPGFLFFVPFYRHDNKNPRYDAYHQPGQFIGLAYAPFIVKKLMSGVLGQENQLLSIKITDQHQPMYDELSKQATKAETANKYQHTFSESIYGRTWTIEVKANPQFTQLISNHQPVIILAMGILIDSMLLTLFIVLARSNRKAILYADKITKEISQKNQTLESLVHFDSLTHLPNRKNFIDTLTQMVARSKRSRSSSFAVCFIDIDDFKQINDNLGHHIGDKLLTQIPKLFLSAIRESDFFARLGGDEFTLIIDKPNNIDVLTKLLKRYLNAINQPITLDGSEIHTSISIGITTYPDGGQTCEELITNADIAMYRAKSMGKNTFAFFDEEINLQVKRHHAIDTAIRSAINNDELRLLYQPQLNIQTNQIIGVEALLRWRHPELGELMPDEFIPIAESNGMIISIGQWVLAKACADIKLIDKHNKQSSIKLAINMSLKELSDEGYKQSIKQTLTSYHMNPSNLFLEVTESLMMENQTLTAKAMEALKEIGVNFALDDFGTGYSSMQYLKTLPLAALKIDKVFTQDIQHDKDDAVIVKAIIQLAHGLGLEVIAEGVENNEQLNYLKKHNCDTVQGYYFSKPLSVGDLIDWNKNRDS